MTKKIIVLRGVGGAGKDTTAKFIRNDLRTVALLAFADPGKEFARYVLSFPYECLWGKSEIRREHFDVYGKEPAWVEAEIRLNSYLQGWAATVVGSTLPERVDPVITRARDLFWSLRETSLVPPNEGAPGLTPRRFLQTFLDGMLSVDRLIWASFGLRQAAQMLRMPDYVAAVITDGRQLHEVELARSQGAEVWWVDRPGAGLDGVAGQHVSEVEAGSQEIRRFDTKRIDNASGLDELERNTRYAIDQVFRGAR